MRILQSMAHSDIISQPEHVREAPVRVKDRGHMQNRVIGLRVTMVKGCEGMRKPAATSKRDLRFGANQMAQMPDA